MLIIFDSVYILQMSTDFAVKVRVASVRIGPAPKNPDPLSESVMLVLTEVRVDALIPAST